MPAISGTSRRPLPSESRPRTSRKYSGIPNSTPNRVNETSVDSAVPQPNRADRNRVRSASGCRPARPRRSSSRTNTPIATAPAAIVSSAAGSPQPSWPALITP
jgi:hypothetical protein